MSHFYMLTVRYIAWPFLCSFEYVRLYCAVMQFRCKYSCWKCVNFYKDRQLEVDADTVTKKKLFANMDTGKHQLLPKINSPYDKSYKEGVNPMTNAEFQKLASTAREMDRYARYALTDPSVPPKARERCRNEFRMCAEWASRGMCGLPPTAMGLSMLLPRDDNDNNNDDVDDNAFDNRAGPNDVLFMMNNCPLACRMCEELESFHKCAGRRHPSPSLAAARPSFRSGELHSFFEEKRVSEEDDGWAEYEPLFASRPIAEEEKEGGDAYDDPYVVVLRKFLSEEEVNHLRTMAIVLTAQMTTSDSPSRNTAYAGSARCNNDDTCNSDDIYQRIMHRISLLTNSTIYHLESMEFVQFGSNTQHQTTSYQHNFQVNSLWKPAGPRVLTLFVFLSDTTSEGGGGELGFPHLDWLRIRPKKGMVVLWPNVRNDNVLESDSSTAFEHLPLKKGGGSVMGAYVHVRLHNWTDASLRGCA
mmetsp:Transcript_13192/g.20709  ORF Transcript_13192/g.20709 Transcript_13192/m.20709 type:complete len:472 (+) Transcript_13192:112-1527(+)